MARNRQRAEIEKHKKKKKRQPAEEAAGRTRTGHTAAADRSVKGMWLKGRDSQTLLTEGCQGP